MCDTVKPWLVTKSVRASSFEVVRLVVRDNCCHAQLLYDGQRVISEISKREIKCAKRALRTGTQ